MSLIDRLHKGDELHREAAGVLEHFGLFSEFVLSDTKRGLDFVKWQRERSGKETAPDGCAIRWCKSGKTGEIRVNDCHDDGSWSVTICESCSAILGLQVGSDLPEANVVQAKLGAAYGSLKEADQK